MTLKFSKTVSTIHNWDIIDAFLVVNQVSVLAFEHKFEEGESLVSSRGENIFIFLNIFRARYFCYTQYSTPSS